MSDEDRLVSPFSTGQTDDEDNHFQPHAEKPVYHEQVSDNEDSDKEVIAVAPSKRVRGAPTVKPDLKQEPKQEPKRVKIEQNSPPVKCEIKVEKTSAIADFHIHDPVDEYPKVINPSRERLEGGKPLYRWGKDVVPAYVVLKDLWTKKEELLRGEIDRKKIEVEIENRAWIAEKGDGVKRKVKRPPALPTDESIEPVHRWWIRANMLAPGEELSTAPWPYFEHKGIIFTPHYVPHGMPLLVRGKEIVLEPESEEICNFWCGAISSDYATKEDFQKNFWEAFTESLPPGHTILVDSDWDGESVTFEDLDFNIIHNFLIERKLAQTESNKAQLPEIKLMEKDKKESLNLHFGRAIIGGLREKLQQFRTEPPSLFRPRGAHPKMGKLKRRTFPEQVSINVSHGAPVPLLDPTYLFGHGWGDVFHKDDVTWLAFYRDNVMQQYKYMYLAGSSGTKGQSDFKKYEKARKLQYKIGLIRREYEKNMKAGSIRDKQIGLAVYLIDRLALRAGNDKEEDEADTVGCCSLRKEHLSLLDERNADGKRQVHFDFLGKDSIPYQATVPMDDLPYKVMGELLDAKKPSDQLFDEIDPTSLNKCLQEWAGMSVSAKVFRTYNASVTLQQELAKFHESGEWDASDITSLKAFYDQCNREVAVLCNHQRAAPKTFDVTIGKMKQRLKHIDDDIEELKAWLEWERADRRSPFTWESAIPDDQEVPVRKSALPATPKVGVIEKRLEQKIKLRTDKDVELETKEANRTVATGTSRMHYMDPRITVAFCKKRYLPIQKVFQKTLVNKFPWAMNVADEFVW
eukprot:GHVH01016462.1.p1 GENE.GHVH01016462.1~~GHVH01016462.1.p1  ORF type:complete len:801 (+),score=110.27 GHVH01016462.1:49-2451(+)